MRTVPQPCGWFSVGGLASKRNSHPLTQRVCVPAPSLHSRYLLLRYCGPVRLPYGAASRVMHSPRALAASTRHSAGAPRFLDRSVPMRRPQPPRRARQLLAPITSPPVSGFITYGRLAAPTLHNEAESGSLALRLTGSPREASPDGLLRPTLARLPVERAIDRASSFQLTRSARLILALHIIVVPAVRDARLG